ncbi:DUF1294 domain-containing protein [Herminiimonas contaminans]|jgi:uncharacterized membrane protein YsdA (DUF1294 family)|uniref:DUF1294 domain-containing protein n=1 Tax=Herminiimonas contaminans TaxID=1111140 RepID=A0ABS0EMT0_9BURK|nr:DUF1294 domain-containing protein [Herminiimonas contaminans]MBF8176074.1 DUF1294 domain-containing protein [Herminiimonas contaminans]
MDSKILLQVLGSYFTLSLLSFAAYAIDKSAARKGTWRISENNLHVLDFLGGWPGGFIAQRLLRHKTSKPSFQRIYWVTVVLHCALVGWLLSPYGSDVLRTLG